MNVATTNNLSFRNLSAYYVEKGFKNSSEVMSLFDTKLDHFNWGEFASSKAYLNPKTKFNVIDKYITECKRNVWFFFREAVRIPDKLSISNNFYECCANYTINPKTALMIKAYKEKIPFIALKNEDSNSFAISMTIMLIHLHSILVNRTNSFKSTISTLSLLDTDKVAFKTLIMSNNHILNDVKILDNDPNMLADYMNFCTVDELGGEKVKTNYAFGTDLSRFSELAPYLINSNIDYYGFAFRNIHVEEDKYMIDLINRSANVVHLNPIEDDPSDITILKRKKNVILFID